MYEKLIFDLNFLKKYKMNEKVKVDFNPTDQNFLDKTNELEIPLLFQKKISLDPEAYYYYYYQKHKLKESTTTKNEALDMSFSEKLKAFKNIYFSPIEKGSIRSSILCLISIALSSVIFSLPYTFAASGLVLGIICFLFVAIISQWSVRLLVEVSHEAQIYDYGLLIKHYFGKRWLLFTEIFTLINDLGSIVVFNNYSK